MCTWKLVHRNDQEEHWKGRRKKITLLSFGSRRDNITKDRFTTWAPNTTAQVSFHHWLNRPGTFLGKELFPYFFQPMLNLWVLHQGRCLDSTLSVLSTQKELGLWNYGTLLSFRYPSESKKKKKRMSNLTVLRFWEHFSAIACLSHMPAYHTNCPCHAVCMCVHVLLPLSDNIKPLRN